jgi:hypothetical protein
MGTGLRRCDRIFDVSIGPPSPIEAIREVVKAYCSRSGDREPPALITDLGYERDHCRLPLI